MKSRRCLGWIVLALAMGVTGGCSSRGDGPRGSGGTTGSGGTSGGGGSATASGGSPGGTGGRAADAGADVSVVPEEPLCPRNGPIVAGPTPLPDGVEIVSSATDVEFLAVTDSHAYWANETKIFRAPLTGGAETVVIDRTVSRNHIEGIAVAGDFVYWSDSGINNALGVARAAADGSGAPSSVIAGNSYQHVVVAEDYVYSNDLGSREIVRAPVTGGPRMVLVREVFPSSMAVAGGYLWVVHPYVNATANVNLLRIPVATVASPPSDGGVVAGDGGINVPPGAERVTPVSNFHTQGVTADATHIFYDDDSKAMRVSIAGGTPNIVHKIPDTSDMFGTVTHYMGVVVPYAGSVYWAPESSGCEPLYRSSGDGMMKTAYVPKIAGPWGIAVSATHVYLAVRGQVLRVPRPQ